MARSHFILRRLQSVQESAGLARFRGCSLGSMTQPVADSGPWASVLFIETSTENRTCDETESVSWKAAQKIEGAAHEETRPRARLSAESGPTFHVFIIPLAYGTEYRCRTEHIDHVDSMIRIVAKYDVVGHNSYNAYAR